MVLKEDVDKVACTANFTGYAIFASMLAVIGAGLPSISQGEKDSVKNHQAGVMQDLASEQAAGYIIPEYISPLAYQSFNNQNVEATERRIFGQLSLEEKTELALQGKFRVKPLD